MNDESTDRRDDSVLGAFDYNAIAKAVGKQDGPPFGWYVGPVEIQLTFTGGEVPSSVKTRKPGVMTWDGAVYALVNDPGGKPPWTGFWEHAVEHRSHATAVATVHLPGSDEPLFDQRIHLGELTFSAANWCAVATVNMQWPEQNDGQSHHE